MPKPLAKSAQKIQDLLSSKGYKNRVQEMPDTTRTVADAAAAVGCTVGQIVKSLVFMTKTSHKAVLAIASGDNRVDESKLQALAGEPVQKADADFARAQTGFVIGGVPPLGHTNPIATFIDEDLFKHAEIWAAAGTPNAVFKLTPQELKEMTAGIVADIKK